MRLSAVYEWTVASLVSVLLASSTSAFADEDYPVLVGDGLYKGRTVWLTNCQACHGDGTADAPRPSRYDEWVGRIAQQRQALYRHAIDGFIGADYAIMPPRGGNDELTDAEVKAAVDYMLELVVYFRQAND